MREYNPKFFCSFHILEKLLSPARNREKSFDSTPETICSLGGDGASPQQATSQTRFLWTCIYLLEGYILFFTLGHVCLLVGYYICLVRTRQAGWIKQQKLYSVGSKLESMTKILADLVSGEDALPGPWSCLLQVSTQGERAEKLTGASYHQSHPQWLFLSMVHLQNIVLEIRALFWLHFLRYEKTLWLKATWRRRVFIWLTVLGHSPPRRSLSARA